MKPRTVFLLVAVAALAVCCAEARKKSAARKASARGSASKPANLRTAKNRNTQDVQNNAAVKKAVANMRSGRTKNQNSGRAPSASSLNQPNAAPGGQRPLSASNLNQPQGPIRQQSATNLNQQQGSPSNTYNQPPPYQQSYGAPPTYQQSMGAPPSYQQAVGGAPPSYQQAMGGYGGQQQMPPMGGGVAYPGGGYPAGGGGGYPQMGAPMGYPMMPMQQAAPTTKKGLIPDFLKPKLMIDVVPLAMMAASPIKSLFSRGGRKNKQPHGQSSNSTENGTMPEGPFPMPDPSMMNGTDSNMTFLPGPPPPFPVDGENGTGYYPPPPPPPMYMPRRWYEDENGTVHEERMPPMPFYPYQMHPPMMETRGENGSEPVAYPQPYPYPPPMPYPYPYGNPFFRRNINVQNETAQVAGPMINVVDPAVIPPMGRPDIMVDPPEALVDPIPDIIRKADRERETMNSKKNQKYGSGSSSEEDDDDDDDDAEPKTGVVYAEKSRMLKAMQPQMAVAAL